MNIREMLSRNLWIVNFTLINRSSQKQDNAERLVLLFSPSEPYLNFSPDLLDLESL